MPIPRRKGGLSEAVSRVIGKIVVKREVPKAATPIGSTMTPVSSNAKDVQRRTMKVWMKNNKADDGPKVGSEAVLNENPWREPESTGGVFHTV